MIQKYGDGLAQLYHARFEATELAAKERVWKVLCRDYFSHFIKPTDSVLDVAAGYREFINHIECAEKVAFDVDPDTARFCAPNVHLVIADCRDMSALAVAS